MRMVRSTKNQDEIGPWENNKLNIVVNKMSLETNEMVQNIVVPDVTINFATDLKIDAVQNRIA